MPLAKFEPNTIALPLIAPDTIPVVRQAEPVKATVPPKEVPVWLKESVRPPPGKLVAGPGALPTSGEVNSAKWIHHGSLGCGVIGRVRIRLVLAHASCIRNGSLHCRSNRNRHCRARAAVEHIRLMRPRSSSHPRFPAHVSTGRCSIDTPWKPVTSRFVELITEVVLKIEAAQSAASDN